MMTRWMTEEDMANKISPHKPLVMAMMVCASRRKGAGVMPEQLVRFDASCFPTREHAVDALEKLEKMGAIYCRERSGGNASTKFYGWGAEDSRSWMITDLGRRAISLAVGASSFGKKRP